MISTKTRLILSAVAFLIAFVSLLVITKTVIFSFLVSLIVFGVLMILTDPLYRKWSAERAAEQRRRNKLKNDEYYREQGRLEARREYENDSYEYNWP